MAFFQNHRALGKFIIDSDQQVTKEKLTSLYKEENFYKDFNRMQEELSINGVPLSSIINIEDYHLSEASNLMFAKLFEDCSSINKKETLEKFLRIFLHQNFLYPHINMLNSSDRYILCNPEKNVDISLKNGELYIEVSFSCHKLYDFNRIEGLIEDPNGDFLVQGSAVYKINAIPIRNGWIAKYGVVSSHIECKDVIKDILDTRSILEKIIDFFNSIMENVVTSLKSNSTIKSKPIFFISKDGKSVDNEFINLPPDLLIKEMMAI
ncbi:hypothetical protein [Rickettsiella endosymbiont of Dermanyssus gallinae]|uniref:hypothetical protein n=1 Tax=Rickettsiella endosymbiont of Dermanyssus gallinae TaxID=2856608 RepID=UPI001C52742E|nr:hypothetical protein [Rickettsiella endosymbiont of Dermanyssus gallinae]